MSEASADLARSLGNAEAATIDVEIEEWGGTVRLRRLVLADVAWTRTVLPITVDPDDFDVDEYRLLQLSRALVIPDLGDDAVEVLRGQPLGILNRLFAAMDTVSEATAQRQFRPGDDAE